MPNGKDLRHILKRVYNHESLVGIDLRNLYLSFMDFSGLELRRADLEGCCLTHALMDECDLTDANLTNVKLNHASLNGAKLAGAILTDVVALASRSRRNWSRQCRRKRVATLFLT